MVLEEHYGIQFADHNSFVACKYAHAASSSGFNQSAASALSDSKAPALLAFRSNAARNATLS